MHSFRTWLNCSNFDTKLSQILQLAIRIGAWLPQRCLALGTTVAFLFLFCLVFAWLCLASLGLARFGLFGLSCFVSFFLCCVVVAVVAVVAVVVVFSDATFAATCLSRPLHACD